MPASERSYDRPKACEKCGRGPRDVPFGRIEPARDAGMRVLCNPCWFTTKPTGPHLFRKTSD